MAGGITFYLLLIPHAMAHLLDISSKLCVGIWHEFVESELFHKPHNTVQSQKVVARVGVNHPTPNIRITTHL